MLIRKQESESNNLPRTLTLTLWKDYNILFSIEIMERLRKVCFFLSAFESFLCEAKKIERFKDLVLEKY